MNCRKRINRRRQARSRNRSDRKGAALVEFAVVLPVIILFVTALIEIARVLMLQHTVDTAAYEGARAAMVPGAIAQEAEDEAQVLMDAAKLTGSNIVVTPSIITEDTAFITVRVEVPVASNSWVSSNRFNDFTVVSEVTLLTERSPIVRLTGIPDLKNRLKKLRNQDIKVSL